MRIAPGMLVMGAALTLALAGGVLLAHAQPPPDQPNKSAEFEQQFKQKDKNGDGKLSPDELPDAALFHKLDANGDGFVTLEEARAGLQQQKPPAPNPEEKFKQLDKNADGKLTPEEVNHPEAFKHFDANGDGAITLDEMKAVMTADANKPKTPAPSVEDKFKQLDKDADGKLTAAEVGNAEAFKHFDANGDGFITLEELKAVMAADANKPRTAPPTVEEKFKAMDKNGDGKLSPEEVNNAELFAHFDTNGDGFLTLDEVKAGMEKKK